MTPTAAKGMTDIAIETARLISERRIDDEQVPIRVPSLGPEAAEIARDAMVVHGLAPGRSAVVRQRRAGYRRAGQWHGARGMATGYPAHREPRCGRVHRQAVRRTDAPTP